MTFDAGIAKGNESVMNAGFLPYGGRTRSTFFLE
jgi:hypothetical protein